MLRKIYLSIITLFISSVALHAQTPGAIKVLLKDKTNGEAIPFANVVAYQGGVQVAVGTTDMDGYAMIKPLEPGKYDVKGVYVGYKAKEIKEAEELALKEKAKELTCQFCSKEFKTKYLLRIHQTQAKYCLKIQQQQSKIEAEAIEKTKIEVEAIEKAKLELEAIEQAKLEAEATEKAKEFISSVSIRFCSSVVIFMLNNNIP